MKALASATALRNTIGAMISGKKRLVASPVSGKSERRAKKLTDLVLQP
jgi:hypothetical protein